MGNKKSKISKVLDQDKLVNLEEATGLTRNEIGSFNISQTLSIHSI